MKVIGEALRVLGEAPGAGHGGAPALRVAGLRALEDGIGSPLSLRPSWRCCGSG